MEERRLDNGKLRKARVTAGGVSVPVAIIVTTILNHEWGETLGQDVTIAIASLVSSAISVSVLCFWDLRAIFLNKFRNRRVRR